MATGLKEGFIEVVQHSETICKIQLSQTEYKTTAVFRKGLLLSWYENGSSLPPFSLFFLFAIQIKNTVDGRRLWLSW